MIKPKIRLVRIEDTFSGSNDKLISEFIMKSKMRIGRKGHVYDDNLGNGFSVRMGQPSTLKEYLYPTRSLTNQADERLSEVKNLLADG
ncbi:MAG: hypothetical protein H8D23_17550 [Candidatus Brocadiales bacterium]|nr:hypothetical protein [Candidatus Brocadiales bacterium]